MGEPTKLKCRVSIVPSPESCARAVNFQVGLGLSSRLTNVQSHPSYKSIQPIHSISIGINMVLAIG